MKSKILFGGCEICWNGIGSARPRWHGMGVNGYQVHFFFPLH